MNRCSLKKDIVWFTPFSGESYAVGKISEANIENGYMILNNECFPLDECFDEEREVIKAWNKLYPNGKPKVEVVVKPTTPIEEQLAREIVSLQNQLFEIKKQLSAK